ncbi:crooked neck-like protein 1 [Vespa mandarinia]|uniref:crooked neck-like protein 1 n=1 Tax=Vespa mandarinia TaxID=7446 RepID=UPI0016095635|nr:crooked neck-like protein 1 [Vespa mandarinia]
MPDGKKLRNNAESKKHVKFLGDGWNGNLTNRCGKHILNLNYNIKKYQEQGIEDVIISKRKYQYEQEVKENFSNYDVWFDYLRLVKSEENHNVVRAYERAIANVPFIKKLTRKLYIDVIKFTESV